MDEYAPTLWRLILGPLFVIPGVDKLMGMLTGGHMVVDMVWGIAALVWILLLVEIIFGLMLFVGYKVRYAVWPLVGVMLGATLLAVVPTLGANPMAMVNLLFHLLAIVGLISLFLTGAGAVAVGE